MIKNNIEVPRIQTPKVEILEMRGHNFLWIGEHLWMWDIPTERVSQKRIADQAHGDILCVGYGLGLVQKYLLENPKVTSVTTVEKYKDVIDLNYNKFGKLYGHTIVSDFFTFTSDHMFDCIVGDICDDIMPEFLSDYQRFKRIALKYLNPNGKLLQWGGDYFEYLIDQKAA